MRQAILAPAEALAQQARRLLAVAVIGVALFEIALGYAVEGGEHHLRREGKRCKMGFDRPGEGVDVDGIVVVGRHGTQRRLPALGEQVREGLVVDGGRRGGGILRIERIDENAFAACRLQGIETAGNRWVAVAHGPVDDDLAAKLG